MVSPITVADPISPLENLLNPLVTAITALELGAGRGSRVIYYAADLNALPASGFQEGDLCHVDEGDFYMARLDSAWAQVTTARFADLTAANTAFNKASAAYRTGARIRLATTGMEFEYLALYNSVSNPMGANPAGWYPPDGTVIASSFVDNSAAPVVITSTATAVAGLSAIGVAPGTPVVIEVNGNWMNAGSGSQQFVVLRPYEDATARGGAAQTFSLPFPTSAGHMWSQAMRIPYTPTAGLHTWTLRDNALALSSVSRWGASVVVRTQTPRF